MHLFFNAHGKLRNLWWVAVFFLVLAAFLFPLLLMAARYRFEVSTGMQALVVLAASATCQMLRRRPFTELSGRFNRRWLRELGTGMLLGAALMLLPAGLLGVTGHAQFEPGTAGMKEIGSATLRFAVVALAEELLFRGFLFQRLLAGIGAWKAQVLTAAYFVLIHSQNPGMSGTVQVLASANIFLASLLFGTAYIKTQSLAMPLGLHFMANWTQGTLLGFGVSGHEGSRILTVRLADGPLWLTGGHFGLEASLPGLLCVLMLTLLLARWKPLLPYPRNKQQPQT